MVAGDVRSLARRYCRRGVVVVAPGVPAARTSRRSRLWAPQAYAWLIGRFGDSPAPSNCGDIQPGNSLAPLKVVPAG